MNLLKTRLMRFISVLLILFLLLPFDGKSAGEPVHLKTSIPKKRVGQQQNDAFGTDLKNWTVTGSARVQDGGCVLAPKSAISQKVLVDFGSDTMKPQRYMMVAKLKADETATESAGTRMGLRTPKDFPRKDYRVSKGWKDYYVVVDTPAAMPGRESGTIEPLISNTGHGNLLIKNFRLYQLPQYGILLRYKILKPTNGLFQDRVSIIRHHRNKHSRNPIERSYFCGVDNAGGKKGVKAGRFSEWIDLRPYLFGDKTATITLSLKPTKPSAKPQPITVLLEMAYDQRTKTISTAKGDEDELSLTDDNDDFLKDLVKEKLPADVFYRKQVAIPTGLYTFILPEDHVPPERFMKTVQDIESDIKRREAWLAELPPLEEKKIIIPIGANLSSMEKLIPPQTISREIELLLKIGINAISQPVDKTISRLYPSLRNKKYPENKHYFDRLYSRVGGYTGISPYDGDTLQNALLTFYKPLKNNRDNKNIYVVELLDEPHDFRICQPDIVPFREFLKARKITPEMLGATKWEDVVSYGFVREQNNPEKSAPQKEVVFPATMSLEKRRLYYYTHLFATQKTSDFFKTATNVVNQYLPNVRTSVNFRAGLRAVLTPETADWFLMGREKAVTMMWNEDWLNTYGWRNNGIQLVSYYVELMRTAARKHHLPIGGFLIMMGQTKLKSYSALAHGSRYLSYWRYGPDYANYLPYSWSGSESGVKDVSCIARDVAQIQEILKKAKREPAEVALLYCKTDPLWGVRQTENRLVYFALLHDQIPVDIITEEEIEKDGILAPYKFLYITDISVRKATLKKIAKWLENGGKLWLSGGATSRDELNEPNNILSTLMAVKYSEPQKSNLKLKKMEQEEYAEIGVNYPLSFKTGEIKSYFADQTPAQITGKVGKGKFCISLFRPGEYYEKTVRPHYNRTSGKGHIQKGWSNQRRKLITDFVLKNGIKKTVCVNVPGVETMFYRHLRKDLVMFMNYTGKYPCPDLEVKINDPCKVKEVVSLRYGKLRFSQKDKVLKFKLSLNQVDSVFIYK